MLPDVFDDVRKLLNFTSVRVKINLNDILKFKYVPHTIEAV